MRELIDPRIARMLVADPDALTAPSRMVFCQDNEKKTTLFGGRAVIKMSDEVKDQNWHMVEGTLIFVPKKLYNWDRASKGNDEICGWTLEDMVTQKDGLMPYNWKEVKSC